MIIHFEILETGFYALKYINYSYYSMKLFDFNSKLKKYYLSTTLQIYLFTHSQKPDKFNPFLAIFV